jgi:hypothetical protein
MPPKYIIDQNEIEIFPQIIPWVYWKGRNYSIDVINRISITDISDYKVRNGSLNMVLGDKDDIDRIKVSKFLLKKGVAVNESDKWMNELYEYRENEKIYSKDDLIHVDWIRNQADPLSSATLFLPLVFALICLIIGKCYEWIVLDKSLSYIFTSSLIIGAVFVLIWLVSLLLFVVYISNKFKDLSTPSYYRLKQDVIETIYKKGTHFNYYHFSELLVLRKWDSINTILLKDIALGDGREGKTKGIEGGAKLFIMKKNDYQDIQAQITDNGKNSSFK